MAPHSPAPPAAATRAIVVSLHDVSPHTWEPCRRILAELEKAGISRTSLLVIPDHHHRGHFLAHPAFCEWLKNEAAGGNEPVLHGYHHLRTPRADETARERWITRTYTAGEGEFFDLSYDAARTVATRGRDELRQIGLDPTGFIAPAWLLGPDAEAAVRDLGFRYTTRIGGVLDLQSRQLHRSQSLCWSVRAAWRRSVSRVWNALLFRSLANSPLLRVAIHPVDIAHPLIWSQITRLITTAASTRTPHTYATWLASGSASPAA